MSFIQSKEGAMWEAGYFLAEADCSRKTYELTQSMATTAADGSKYVPAGTVYPANNNTAMGIVYEDVDVSTGSMAGSIVTKGVVYTDRLAVTLDSDAKTALEALGFKFIATSESVTRPY